MTYDSLKIIHIVSASFLLGALGYSYHLWRNTQSLRDSAVRFARIQTLTWLLIMPLALIQLATGGMMISLKHEDMAQTWISASLMGFVLLILAWFSFIYFLLLSQQIDIKKDAGQAFQSSPLAYRRAQSCMLVLTALAVLLMVFFMSSKVA